MLKTRFLGGEKSRPELQLASQYQANTNSRIHLKSVYKISVTSILSNYYFGSQCSKKQFYILDSQHSWEVQKSSAPF